MIKTYRQGAVGALLDIYEQVINELKTVIEDIPDALLTVIVDPQTTDDNCRSFQTILAHVVHAAYGYATSIHNSRGNNIERPEKVFHTTIEAYILDLSNVFNYTENVFQSIDDKELRQRDTALKIRTGWEQVYDIEQLMEHAIVHILRHKRQIKKFKHLALS